MIRLPQAFAISLGLLLAGELCVAAVGGALSRRHLTPAAQAAPLAPRARVTASRPLPKGTSESAPQPALQPPPALVSLGAPGDQMIVLLVDPRIGPQQLRDWRSRNWKPPAVRQARTPPWSKPSSWTSPRLG